MILNNYHAQDIKSLLSARNDNRTSAGTYPYRRHRPGMINAGGAMAFSGKVWVGGKLLTVPTTGVTQFLSVPLDGTTTCAWVSSMPVSQMPSNAEVFDTSQTAGDIHLAANFGGG